MAALTITRETYRDKVYGGWLGKNIGGTLGAPVEGRKEILKLAFYDPIPGQAAANDDLDIQLVWLHALRAHGIGLTSDDLADEWLDHFIYPWDEYGYATANMRRGLRPPITGAFNNWFKNSMGATIRSEIWAMIAPGAPQVAAAYAYRDGILDHAEEGVWGLMFWAAIESAAFFLGGTQQLLDVGLAMIPANCRVARAVRIARDAWREQASWVDARGRILQAVGHDNVTDAPQNIGFTVLGWLYGGGNLGASLCAAVNCGYDTDTTGATLGAVLGIINGKSGLPEDWLKPIGDAVVLGWGVVNLEVERTTAELTEHTLEIGERVLAEKCPDVALVEALPVDLTPQPPSLEGKGEAEPATEEAASEPVAQGTPGEVRAEPSAEPAAVETPPLAVPDDALLRQAAESGQPQPSPPAEIVPEQPVETVAPPAASPQEVPPEQHGAESDSELTGEQSEGTGGSDDQSKIGNLKSEIPPAPPPVNWLDNAQVKPLLVAPSSTAVYHTAPFEIVVDYGEGGPAIAANAATSFTVAIRNVGAAEFMGCVNLSAPPGWQVAVPGAQGQRQMLAPGGMARYGFVVRAPENVPLQPQNKVTLVLTPENAPPTTCDIILLGGACWWWVGPFENRLEEGFYKAYEVEDRPGFDRDYLGRGAALIRWRKIAFKENVLLLEQEFFTGQPGVAYGVTTLHLPVPTEAKIVPHTNDGLRVWLNNRLLVQRHSHEPFRPTLGYGPSAVDVTLQAGDNRLMVKVIRCDAPAEFAFAVTDRDGKPLPDVGNTRWS
jgi:ADP-ribosylglycohydrolase